MGRFSESADAVEEDAFSDGKARMAMMTDWAAMMHQRIVGLIRMSHLMEVRYGDKRKGVGDEGHLILKF